MRRPVEITSLKPQRPTRLRVLGVGPAGLPFEALARVAVEHGAAFERVATHAEAKQRLAAATWHLVVPAVSEASDAEIRGWIELLGPSRPCPLLVLLASHPSASVAMDAARLGVFDVLPLSANRHPFLRVLARAQAAHEEAVLALPTAQPVAIGPYEIVAESSAMLDVCRTIAQVAPTDATALIQGASGTGKELVARAIHLYSRRVAAPFVALNCAAIPDSLLESELFGHERGAFTGAVARRVGRFERADGGTLFLDEIGEMSPALQSKILRAVQEREIERVGGKETIRVDVRVIAATSRDLQSAVGQGVFRPELFYRLSVVVLRLPPLGERGDDLLLLTGHFLRDFGRKVGKEIRFISLEAIDRLQRHQWSGNVRELRNVMERASILVRGDTLRSTDLPDDWASDAGAPAPRPLEGAFLPLRDVEARHVAEALARTGGQVAPASRLLGIHRNTLTRKVREYGLQPHEQEASAIP